MAGEILKAGNVLKIGQRVEFYLENDDERYTSRIEDITPTQLIVAMPVDSKRRPIIPAAGEQLYAMAVGDQCRYQFFSIYQDKDAVPIPVWKITRPEIVERHQNRAFVRVLVTLPVKVQAMNDKGGLDPVTETKTVDLSGGGLCFVWPVGIPLGRQAVIELNNIPYVGTMQVMTRIARCVRVEQSDKAIYHIGVRFLTLTRPVSNKLVHFIFDLQRKSLAKGIEI